MSALVNADLWLNKATTIEDVELHDMIRVTAAGGGRASLWLANGDAGDRRPGHAVRPHRLAHDLVPALLPRLIHRDITHHRLDADDASVDVFGRAVFRMSILVAIVTGQRRAGTTQPQDRRCCY
jgi:hypothetical protein